MMLRHGPLTPAGGTRAGHTLSPAGGTQAGCASACGERPEANAACASGLDHMQDDDHPRDECGVLGLFNVPDAARVAALGLHALQHRGQESAGIAVSHEGTLSCHRGMGLVSRVFGQGEAQAMPGLHAVGHVRYSTTGSSSFVNAQPLLGRYIGGEVALAHNGNLAASKRLNYSLCATGALFQTTTDSEIFLHLLAQEQATDAKEIARVLSLAGSAFAVVMLFPDRLIAARDPLGFRPLALGRLKEGWVAASESCAFDQIGASFEREIEPGEMVVCDAQGCRSLYFGERGRRARCLLELIYFARPDSLVFGETPHLFRQRSGEALAREHPADVDIVVAIPDSGVSAGMGFARGIGRPLDRGLIRNHYIGRSFIAPGQEARAAAVRMKHNVVREVVRGKRVALVDDSLIRGTTTAALGGELRAAGALEVHLRIACPPTRHPCIYGVDFPRREELMAHNHSLEEIRKRLDMDSLGYLSLEGITGLFGKDCDSFCTACWSGSYPVLEE
ncbi:amidophosphoribosyltransferase [Desulfovibrio sp. OttesenSCG-928-A18]|nr:amidophosphoribosyltransferase [Desulfovibrio sp. OttesenSCG-928-A18]